MTTFLNVLVFALPVLALAAAIFVAARTMRRTGNVRRAFSRHFITLVMAIVLCLAFTFVAAAAPADTGDAAAAAATAVETAADNGAGMATGLGFLAAALSIGLAAIGAGIALSAGAPAAIGAVSEDPKSFGKSMIFVVLGEAVAIYGLIIAILIILKIPNLPTLG